MTATLTRPTQDVNVATMRFARQTDLLTPDVCTKPVHIIGAGATGSFLALSLAKMGLTDITIYDADKVEEHNFPNQLFHIAAKGQNKALAVKELVKMFTDTEIKAIPEMFKGKHQLTGIVVSALDSMKGRKLIHKSVHGNPHVELLIDPRTGPELFTVASINPNSPSESEAYAETIVKDSDVVQAPCTARAIIYTVLAVSSVIASQIKKYLMKEELKGEIIIDLKESIGYFGT
jgi:hypothetical protein